MSLHGLSLPDPLTRLQKTARAWGLALSQNQIDLIELYTNCVLDWNKKTNLTADNSFQAILLRHICDGLAAARLLRPFFRETSPSVAEVGAGAGFVGITLKIALPELNVTLIESSQKRYDFLNIAAVKIGLPGLKIIKKKIPQDFLGSLAGKFAFVLERALAPLSEAMEICWPLAAPGGIFAAYQSAPPDCREASLKRRLDLFSAKFLKSAEYRLPDEEQRRCLSFFLKPPEQETARHANA
ncbi:MAG: 16S rRNA (guanine(527)-N(7))-methyltransferase RsmG [Elusimicrobiota bacterium]